MKTGIARLCQLVVPPCLFVFSSLLSRADPAPLNNEWKFDTIQLKNGCILRGVILTENPISIRFQHVRRAAGRPTVSMTSAIRRADIDRIVKIPNGEREIVIGRLKELDPSGEGERKRMESLKLVRCDWNGKPDKGWRYDSDHFSLLSNAHEEVVCRAAVRLEQIYTAYLHFLPPRFAGGKPTTIVLYPAFDDYQEMLAKGGWKFQNPAFFSLGSNRIFCGSNLRVVGDDLEKARSIHKEALTEVIKHEAELRKYFKNPTELAQRLKPDMEIRWRIANADKYNDTVFDNATKRLFAVLYHESFHAYVSNFVYPSGMSQSPGELPRWLNEGLAQIFETAIVEAGELRVGHVDKDRLRKVKEAVQKNQLMPVKDLLEAGPKAFLVHNNDQTASDKAYLASWALSAYLTFDRRLLGTKNLDEFVRSINGKVKPEEAFARLTGQKIPEFEKHFLFWLSKLPDEGSMLEAVVAKDR